MYQVKKIEGKGMGCIASVDIERGSLILSENPQIPDIHLSSQEVLTLWESYKRMSEADQLEYMTLHNKYDDIDIWPLDMKPAIVKELLNTKSKISLIFGLEKEKVETIFKIYNIYASNSFSRGLRIKTSRFNHSCQPNASDSCQLIGQDQIRAISHIKQGEEITISYLGEHDFSMRNRKYRQEALRKGWFFICSCDLCEHDVDNKDDTFQEFIKEASEYHKINSTKALAVGRANGNQHYPLEICRREVACYKQIYKIAKDKNVQPISLFKLVEKAFGAATLGYQLYKTADLKNDAENFAKTAEKFGKILGKDLVMKGKPDYWKQKYEKFELCLLHQPYGYGYNYIQGI